MFVYEPVFTWAERQQWQSRAIVLSPGRPIMLDYRAVMTRLVARSGPSTKKGSNQDSEEVGLRNSGHISKRFSVILSRARQVVADRPVR
jgi:hypothetical protein